MNRLSSLFKTIVRFWLTPRDTASISVCRILVGLVSIQKALHVLPNASILYGASNPIVAAETARQVWSGFHLCLFNLVNDSAATDFLAIAIPCLHLLAAIAVTVGFKTNFSLFLLLLTASSMSFRNLMVVTGADSYQITTLALLLFSRCGGRYSVDYYLAKRAGKFYRTWSIPAFEYLIRMQLFMLYVSVALVKLIRPVWQEGYALYYVLRQKNFQLFQLPAPFYEPSMSKVFTYFTLVLETVLALGLWFKPIRYPLLILAVLFHMGMHLTLNIPLFQPFVIATLICFVDPKDVRKVERFLSKSLNKFRQGRRAVDISL
jgi:hypothetical protein